MPHIQLEDRALVLVSGDDAETFLQSVITTDLNALAQGEAKPGALLSPQGKILFDFLISRIPAGFRLDCRAAVASQFMQRLTLYRLRAKVEISTQDQPIVMVFWNGDSASSSIDSTARDSRFPVSLTVLRHYGDGPAGAGGKTGDIAEWNRLRATNGIAESGSDYALGDSFPHEALFDRNGGVSFTKGCYIGQEVVSRMQHRGTARKRIVMVESASPLPPGGTAIVAGERPLGTLGTVTGTTGLALIRTDRVGAAINAGVPITAAGVELVLSVPDWAGFSFSPATETENN